MSRLKESNTRPDPGNFSSKTDIAVLEKRGILLVGRWGLITRTKWKKGEGFNIFINPDSLYFSFSSSSFLLLSSFSSFSPPPLSLPSNTQNLYIYSLLNSSDPRNSTSRNGYVFKNGLSPFPSSSSLLDPLPLPLLLVSFMIFHRYASSNPLVWKMSGICLWLYHSWKVASDSWGWVMRELTKKRPGVVVVVVVVDILFFLSFLFLEVE